MENIESENESRWKFELFFFNFFFLSIQMGNLCLRKKPKQQALVKNLY